MLKVVCAFCFTFFPYQTMAATALEPGWKQELVDRGLPQEVIDFFEIESVTTAARFANYIDNRSKLAVNNKRAVKGMLTELWREVDHAESLRLQRKAPGMKEDDLEDPLPSHVGEGLRQRFLDRYRFQLPLSETLCEPILGRIKREIDRKTHTLIAVDRVRSAKESSREAAGKRW